MAFLALLMAWMFSVGCCCTTTTTLTPGVANANATVVAPDAIVVEQCSRCGSEGTPAQYEVDITTAPNNSSCTECANWNATWILDQQASYLPPGCAYGFDGAMPCDGEASRATCFIQVVIDVFPTLRRRVFTVYNFTTDATPICGGLESFTTGDVTSPASCDKAITLNLLDGVNRVNCSWTSVAQATLTPLY